jgi:hypothetical protein
MHIKFFVLSDDNYQVFLCIECYCFDLKVFFYFCLFNYIWIRIINIQTETALITFLCLYFSCTEMYVPLPSFHV